MIAVVIPCYRVRDKILSVLREVGPEVESIICVDDACPENSGDLIQAENKDSRVRVVRHEKNEGVGGAMVTGYRTALEAGAEIVVKLDGDAQMDPKLIPVFVDPIRMGIADYTKGNRFYRLESLRSMPTIRLVGNAVLSFLTKLSSGYWDIFDPTNGFTAVHAKVLREIPLQSLSRRYFFESDLLFRLNIARACVVDIPMTARYSDEKSSLRIRSVVFEFLFRHGVNTWKRIFYNYFLRDFSVASIQLLLGSALLFFGLTFGTWKWLDYGFRAVAAPTGTVMLAVMTTLIGIQLLLGFLAFDMRPGNGSPVHKKLS